MGAILTGSEAAATAEDFIHTTFNEASTQKQLDWIKEQVPGVVLSDAAWRDQEAVSLGSPEQQVNAHLPLAGRGQK